jgi:hypothetical protein
MVCIKESALQLTTASSKTSVTFLSFSFFFSLASDTFTRHTVKSGEKHTLADTTVACLFYTSATVPTLLFLYLLIW